MFCATGPGVLSTSIIETLYINNKSNVLNDVRLTKYYDFHDYKGHSKVKESTSIYNENGETYWKLMQRNNVRLLKERIPLPWNGRLLTVDNRSFQFVIGEIRYGFRDWDAFLAFEFKKNHIIIEKVTKEECESLLLSDIKLTENDIPRVYQVIQDKADEHERTIRDILEDQV